MAAKDCVAEIEPLDMRDKLKKKDVWIKEVSLS